MEKGFGLVDFLGLKIETAVKEKSNLTAVDDDFKNKDR